MLGRLWFALVDEGEAFNPVTHARNDLDVASCALKKNDELSVWAAELGIRNPGGGMFKPGAKRRMHISEEVDGVVSHVMTGRIEGWPIGPAGRLVTLSVVGKFTDQEAVENAALAGIDDDPYDLFRDPAEAHKPEIRLAARHAALNWRRDDAAPQLVDLVQGDGFLDLADGWIEGSLNFDQLSAPIARVDVVLKASWNQAVLKAVNIGDAFGDEGNFATISAPDWDKLPKVGDTIGDWTVLRVSKHETGHGSLNQYSDYFEANAQKNRSVSSSTAVSFPVRFKRKFYNIDLVAAAILTAKRTETIRFSVSWAGQPISGYEGTVEPLPLDVRNLDVSEDLPDFQSGIYYENGDRIKADNLKWECQTPYVSGASLWSDFDKWSPVFVEGTALGGSVMGQFFGAPAGIDAMLPNGNQQFWVRDPDPGMSAVLFAYNQAKAKVLSGNRIIRCSFDVPWQTVRHLHGSERIRVTDPDIPGGEITGKIVNMSADLIRGVASITIAAIPGKGANYPAPQKPVYAYQMLDAYGIVEAEIINRYDDQEALLLLNQHPVEADLTSLAEANSTKFRVQLSGVPKGSDLSVDLQLGNYLIDSAAQIDMEHV